MFINRHFVIGSKTTIDNHKDRPRCYYTTFFTSFSYSYYPKVSEKKEEQKKKKYIFELVTFGITSIDSLYV